MRPLPLIDPNPPRLSQLGDALARVEASGVYSNNGPEVRALEAEATAQLWGGHGATLAVNNATIGLMIALRDAAGPNPQAGALCLMPALTFAATAQAAIWAGLTPLICDIDPDDWSAAAAHEDDLLDRYAGKIAVVMPYATFGNAIDLDRYVRMRERHGAGVVVDAASSLGTVDDAGRGFGADVPFAVVGSMHATKTFAVGEGGLIHSGDPALIARLRSMANFGFEEGRRATLPGLNAKLPEVLAVAARAKLAEIDAVADRRLAVEAAYRHGLAGLGLQRAYGRRRAMQFMPVLLPRQLAARRDELAAALEAQGIGTSRYFSPHLGEQPWFRQVSLIEATPVADDIAGRLLSLPITDSMTAAEATHVAGALQQACSSHHRPRPAAASQHRPGIAEVVIVGGGPAGTALLTAASKRGLLPDLARGMVLVERDSAIGGGRLGRYAITSDSTAETFLTAICDNPHPEIAALVDHPSARGVAHHQGALGVPLNEIGPLLRASGERLAGIARKAGGTILSGHEATGATRGSDGLWTVALRRLIDGATVEQRTRALVIATGGHQPLDRLATQRVAGASLVELAGDRLLQSDGVLAQGGFAQVADLLAGKRSPRIAVVGGSTSALTTIALLLKSSPVLPLGTGGITLLHRRPLRPFYHSVEAAHAEGFNDFCTQDICPVSGFVYRLAGFRLEARELVLRMLGVDGRAPEPRVATHRIAGDDATARDLLARADLVIAALGYRPHGLPLCGPTGRLALAADRGEPMVDRHCRVLDAAGSALPGVYGIGLAAGFVPWGRLGGEASFAGQANGLWLWQNDVGVMILDQLLGQEARAAA